MAVSIAMFACSAEAQYKGDLTVQVEGLNGQKGLLCYKLFSGSQGFPDSNEKAVKKDCIKITEEPIKLTFKNLTAGSYAVAVFHDTNGDRKLNRNSAGMPLEGYGFSNNPAVKTGPPKFGQAVFLVAGPNTNIRIQMKYGN
ncbi:DUF2141 domain-containing protein [Leptodesmis sp.]|uniref:DUF2141 domain-containing protein n=1 Tax=Leptodesmis sp. TaxID=3100501 RepID=UPI0040534787